MSHIEFLGALEVRPVLIDGRLVDKLEGYEHGAMMSLTLDGRFGLDIPVELAESVTEFVAQALAIGRGFASHGGPPKPPFPRWHEISSMEQEGAT